MPSPFSPCLATRSATVPAGPNWLHEVKHDGYRLIVQRDGSRVRLFTRRGFDWSGRFPLISDAAKQLRTKSFVLDGEALFLRSDGRSDFDMLHTRAHDDEIRLVAFDLLAIGGKDVRRESLDVRKARLERLLRKTDGGIQLSEHMEGEIGPAMFEHACQLGLEGIVSKRRDRPYKAGRCSDWVKIKNREHPAMNRGELFS
jgi:ATP-dependent DNA ligase